MTSEKAYQALMAPIDRYEGGALFDHVVESMAWDTSWNGEFDLPEGVELLEGTESPEEGVDIDISPEQVAIHVRQILSDPDQFEGAKFAYKLLIGALIPHQVYCQYRVDIERKIEASERMWSKIMEWYEEGETVVTSA